MHTEILKKYIYIFWHKQFTQCSYITSMKSKVVGGIPYIDNKYLNIQQLLLLDNLKKEMVLFLIDLWKQTIINVFVSCIPSLFILRSNSQKYISYQNFFYKHPKSWSLLFIVYILDRNFFSCCYLENICVLWYDFEGLKLAASFHLIIFFVLIL